MSLEETLARAIAAAFWETAETPMSWMSMSRQQREVFLICGKRAVEAARAFKAEKVKAA